MNENKKLSVLLEALAHVRGVAVTFAHIRGVYDPEFLQDAVQETAYRIVASGARTFDPTVGDARPYVARILHNVCVWQLHTFYSSIKLPENIDIMTSEWNPLEIAIRHEEISQASATIERLPAHLGAAARRSPERRRPNRTGTLHIRRTSTGDVHYFRAKDRFLAELVALRREKRPAHRRPKK